MKLRTIGTFPDITSFVQNTLNNKAETHPILYIDYYLVLNVSRL